MMSIKAEQYMDLVRDAAAGGNGDEQRMIAEIGLDVLAMLLRKNRQYGASATHPIRVFSKSDPIEGINIRLDDKLSRIRNGAADDDEDPIFDMIGYLILRIVAERGTANG